MKSSKFFFPFFLFFLFIFSFQTQAQWSQKSFDFDNITRDYWIYVPPNYNPTIPASLVVTLHGMGDSAENFKGVGFNLVADTANFIVLVPNALVFNTPNPLVQAIFGGMRTWNSGAGIFGVFPNNQINDVGFINKMVDATIDDYSIDQTRVYMCGFSMGGFMTQRMAIESNGRYAAFASGAGTIGIGIVNPNPGRGIPLAYFNGTVDPKVNWQSGNPMFGVVVDSMVNFWVDNNNCDTPPIHTVLPDTQNDGFTVEHDLYPNGDDGSVLEVFKVIGAGHEWLGFDKDISYTREMWKFFSRYSFQTAEIDKEALNNQLKIYPNPTKDNVNIQFSNEITEPYTLTLYDTKGRKIIESRENKKDVNLQLGSLNNGIYLLNVNNSTMNTTKRIVVE